MNTIPKPNHCGQNWLEMKPTDGGRICGHCEKIIVDFSKMSWSEIEKLQRKNNNVVCGMYNPRQLDNWGQEIPTYNKSILKAAAITGLSVSIASSSIGQTTNASDSIVINGKIIDEKTSEELAFANVFLRHNRIGTVTDTEGCFKLVVRNISTTPLPDTLEITCIGYRKKQIIFQDLKEINNNSSKIKLDDGKFNLTLAPQPENVIMFYVTKPTLRQRIKWKLNKWFRRNEN